MLNVLLTSRLFVTIYIEFRIYRTIILCVVLWGHETWSLTLREEYKLRVFENRVLFGPKREEVVGGCRRLHNKELHNLYTLPNIIRVFISRRMRWA
jgi:hypothetical protein